MSNEINAQTERLIEGLVRPSIRELKSYFVPDASGLLKLDAMENPFPWPGPLGAQWQSYLAKAEVNRYPSPVADGVRSRLSKLLELDELGQRFGVDLDIMLGNGSDEIIQILTMCLASKERGVLAPEPSFVMYDMITRYVDVPYHGVPLLPDFQLDRQAFLAALEEHDPALVFLAVPNNPTGNVFALEDVRAVIEAASGLVVLDEAYMAFTDSDLLSLSAEYSNVVVMRTLSKVGLAGLRLGFLVGSKQWLVEFDKLRLPYNINVLTQLSAEFALDHYEILFAQSEELREARTVLTQALNELEQLEVFDSEANFILVRCNNSDAKDVFEKMKNDGVLIKCLAGGHPLLENCLRLTVGSQEQNSQMLQALKRSL